LSASRRTLEWVNQVAETHCETEAKKGDGEESWGCKVERNKAGEELYHGQGFISLSTREHFDMVGKKRQALNEEPKARVTKKRKPERESTDPVMGGDMS